MAATRAKDSGVISSIGSGRVHVLSPDAKGPVAGEAKDWPKTPPCTPARKIITTPVLIPSRFMQVSPRAPSYIATKMRKDRWLSNRHDYLREVFEGPATGRFSG